MNSTELIWKIALGVETSLLTFGLFREFALPKLRQKMYERELKNVELSSSLKKTKKIKLDGHGNWLKIDRTQVEVVDTIKRIPGLKYAHVRKPEGYSGWEEYVIVTDEVGSAIEMYAQLDDEYAGMSLDEFLLRTLFDQLSKKNDK